MFFREKPIPLQARKALGFRGKIGDRSCFICGNTEENNFDENGRLQMLKVISRDKNIWNTKSSNHIFTCERCRRRGR